MPQSGISKTDLLPLLKSGVPKAFSLLYDHYWESLYIQAYKRVKDEDVAKDMVQNVFIDIWQRRATLDINSLLEHYLNAAVRFQVFSYFRSEKVKNKVINQTLQRFEASATINDLEGYYQLEQLIANAVELLPEKMKEAYLLKAAKHSTPEIAQKLNLKEQTVSNHLTEALRRIRVKIGPNYPEWTITIVLAVIKSLHN